MRTGSCLCGSVTFTADAMANFNACHCSMCRKWCGGPFMAVPCQDAAFTGPVQVYASTERIERGFCGTCGSSLYFHIADHPIHAIPVSLFDDPSGLTFKAEIYVDDKPDYYSFANDTRKMTGAEFAAKVRGG